MRHVSCRFQDFSRRYAVVQNIEPIEFRIQATDNRQSSTGIVGSVFQENDSTEFCFQVTTTASSEIIDWIDKVCDHLQNSLELYKEGIKLGIARETASMILPLAMQTRLYMTGSIRSWIHILDVRDDSHAQKEAQLIAKEIKKIFKEELPIISSALNY